MSPLAPSNETDPKRSKIALDGPFNEFILSLIDVNHPHGSITFAPAIDKISEPLQRLEQTVPAFCIQGFLNLALKSVDGLACGENLLTFESNSEKQQPVFWKISNLTLGAGHVKCVYM